MKLAEIGDVPYGLMGSWHSMLFGSEAVAYCSWDSNQSSPSTVLRDLQLLRVR